MSQFFAGGAALVLALVLWGLGRRPRKPLLRSTDAGAVAALNRAQVELVQAERALAQPSAEDPLDGWTAPVTPAERRALEECLRHAIAGDPDQRLLAVRLAGLWGHRSGLPVLRRGLRDVDPRVVEAAAAAIDTHRCAGPTRPSERLQQARPPRNVARMR